MSKNKSFSKPLPTASKKADDVVNKAKLTSTKIDDIPREELHLYWDKIEEDEAVYTSLSFPVTKREYAIIQAYAKLEKRSQTFLIKDIAKTMLIDQASKKLRGNS